MAARAKSPTAEPFADEPSHRLRRLFVAGGFLDRAALEFAPGLNCIIGGRGTGKTTVMEFIRFALAAMPPGAAARKRVVELVGRNLGDGRIELEVETKDGVVYALDRGGEDEEPIVRNEDRRPTPIRFREGGLFSADIFSQNEIEDIADDPTSQLSLIDSFEARQLGEISQSIQDVLHELATNAGAVEPLRKKVADLSEALAALPGVDEKLKGLAAVGGGDADALNRAQNEKSIRDRQTRAINAFAGFLDDRQKLLTALLGGLEREVRTLFPADTLAGTHREAMEAVVAGLTGCARDVDAALKQAIARLNSQRAALTTQSAELSAAHAKQEAAYKALLERHQESKGRAAERTRLERQRNELLLKQREAAEAQSRLSELGDWRATLLNKLRELRNQRFRIRQQIADRINLALTPTVRVTVMQDGDNREYRDFLVAALQGTRVRATALEKIADAFWPVELAEAVKADDAQRISDRAELAVDQVHKVIAALSAPERLHELETIELQDLPKIELNDGGNHKDTQTLSTGQKCTAILPIVLMESERPLLIDQPEDNLDNAFISETVVKSLHKVKTRRQIVFVTHNPNIPVLGDADRVFVMQSDGRSASMVKAGSVDDCRDEIINLLEGGADAFRRRSLRYKC